MEHLLSSNMESVALLSRFNEISCLNETVIAFEQVNVTYPLCPESNISSSSSSFFFSSLLRLCVVEFPKWIYFRSIPYDFHCRSKYSKAFAREWKREFETTKAWQLYIGDCLLMLLDLNAEDKGKWQRRWGTNVTE